MTKHCIGKEILFFPEILNPKFGVVTIGIRAGGLQHSFLYGKIKKIKFRVVQERATRHQGKFTTHQNLRDV